MTELPEGQEMLPHMPEPVTPEPPEQPEPMWIEATIEIQTRVKVDVAGLVWHKRQEDKHYLTDAGPLNYDDITLEYLKKNGYGPGERGSVFIHNNVEDTLDVSVWHGGTSKDGETRLIEELPFWDTTEIRFKWDDRSQRELDERLGEESLELGPAETYEEKQRAAEA